MDAAPVETVLEARAECSDLDRARAALADALASSRGPRRARDTTAWRLTMRVLQDGGERRAEGMIVDDRGAIVAQRVLSDRVGRACVPLARALGAWASLVLDDEMSRAHDPSSPPAEPAITVTESTLTSATHPGVVGDSPDPDRAASSTNENARSVETGGTLMIRGGDGSGGFTAVSPFVTIEVARSWLLRPSLVIGVSTSSDSRTKDTAVLGGRLDFCRRVPGNYIDRRGIELDVCLGGDGLALAHGAASTAGPSANLRGELGAGLAVELRGAAGAVLVQGPVASPDGPPVMASAELGLSMRFP